MRYLMTCLLFLTLFVVPLQAIPKTSQVLLAMEKARLTAIQKKDVATLESQLTEDYTLTFEEGLVFDKTQVLEMVRHRPEGRHIEWTEETKVRVYDDVAIVTGRYFHDIRKPKRKLFESRYTDTYIKHNGQWYLAATHFTQALVRN